MGSSICCCHKREGNASKHLKTPNEGDLKSMKLAQCHSTFEFGKTDQVLDEEGLVCAICLGVLRDAVKDPCGHSYGDQCIKSWLKRNQKCPISQKPLRVQDLVPDKKMRQSVVIERKQSQERQKDEIVSNQVADSQKLSFSDVHLDHAIPGAASAVVVVVVAPAKIE